MAKKTQKPQKPEPKEEPKEDTKNLGTQRGPKRLLMVDTIPEDIPRILHTASGPSTPFPLEIKEAAVTTQNAPRLLRERLAEEAAVAAAEKPADDADRIEKELSDADTE